MLLDGSLNPDKMEGSGLHQDQIKWTLSILQDFSKYTFILQQDLFG